MHMKLAALAVCLAGCASSPPTNPSNPSANFAADRWACQQQVAAMAPVAAPAPAQAPRPPTSAETNCQPDLMGGMRCTTQQVAATPTPTDAMFNTMAQLSAQRAQQQREGAWRNCMMAKGWQ
jgi:hypothetical protein